MATKFEEKGDEAAAASRGKSNVPEVDQPQAAPKTEAASERVRPYTYKCPECGSKLTVADGFIRCTNNETSPGCDLGVRQALTVEQFNAIYRDGKTLDEVR